VSTVIHVPNTAIEYGFRNPPAGTHTGRSMMLTDLRRLLAACPRDSSRADYGRAIERDNVLSKPTASAKHWAFKKLRELYTLDPKVVIFKALLDLWDADEAAQPMLALLCAAARDPILRVTAPVVLRSPIQAIVDADRLSAAAQEAFPSHFSATVLKSVGQHTASTWQQAGHLSGRAPRVRSHPATTPTAVTYALLLAYLCGGRGDGLFESFWVSLLDAPASEIREKAIQASRHGWLEYRSVGGITDVEFRWLLGGEHAVGAGVAG
jgi:hypothetical protein